MNNLKRILILLTGTLMALKALAADAPDRPLHVLYLGPVSAGGGARGGSFGAPRTNYVYLPGAAQNHSYRALRFIGWMRGTARPLAFHSGRLSRTRNALRIEDAFRAGLQERGEQVTQLR